MAFCYWTETKVGVAMSHPVTRLGVFRKTPYMYMYEFFFTQEGIAAIYKLPLIGFFGVQVGHSRQQ